MISEIVFYMLAFTGFLAAGFMFANIMTRGLVWGVTKVRLFGQWRGWILVKVHTVSRPYYRIGTMVSSAEGKSFFEYTPRNNVTPGGQKTKKMIVVPKGAIEVNMGLDYLEVDEETNNILNMVNWKAMPGHDAEATDALYKRVATLPKSMSKHPGRVFHEDVLHVVDQSLELG